MATLADYINNAINGAASSFGIPADYLRRLAVIESANDPNARNPSGASGLFQFMPGTAADYNLSNPFDPVASAYAAAAYTRDSYNSLMSALGRAPTSSELYLAHQQGRGGAVALLSAAPGTSAVDALAPLYGGNRNRALQAVIQNAGQAEMSAAAFATHVQEYYLGGNLGTEGAASPIFTASGYAGAPVSGGGSLTTVPATDSTISIDPSVAAAGGNWFLRGVIIVLGFIFVGVGLSMFREKAVVVLKEAVRA